MSILLFFFLAICLPELMLCTEKAKALHEINLHTSNYSVSEAYTRIIGGKQAFQGEYPWQAALVWPDKSRGIFCGGSLIKPSWVLTAAHCVLKKGGSFERFLVRMGAYKTDPDIGRFPRYGQEFSVLSITVHPGYDSDTGSHDVALVKLNGRARKTKYVKTVALPMGAEAKRLRPYQACVVTGFGDVDEKGTSPKYLQQVHVNVAEQAYCADLYEKMGHHIDDSMICAGKIRGKYDSCQGDSGGPLVCRHDPPKKANQKKKNFYLKTKFLHGVVSWGIGCGQPKQYGVYANVTYFVPWIEWFSFECRKTKTKVITLANHVGHRQYIEPIKTRRNYMWLTQSAGKCMRARHNWLWFYF